MDYKIYTEITRNLRWLKIQILGLIVFMSMGFVHAEDVYGQAFALNQKENLFIAQSGEISGRVIDLVNGEPLIGVNVIVANSAIGASTDTEGEFHIRRVPEGSQTIIVNYLGYLSQSIDVEIVGGETLEIVIEMVADVIEGDELIIYSQALGQARAIRAQLASNTIVNIVSEERLRELPDANAAESIGRLPGVSLIRDAGEGQKVAIRGMGPEYSTITIDGIRVPGTDDDRSVDLSMISPEMLSGIEVYKTIRPDMDADAIGGAVNFKMGGAPSGPRYRLNLGGGYSTQINDIGTYKATFSGSNRFLKDNLGVMATINAQQVDRSSHTLSSGYRILRDKYPEEPHAPIEVTGLNLEDTFEIRQRFGGSVSLDLKIPNGRLISGNSLNQQHREGHRRQRQYDLGQNRQEWRIREREIDIFTMNNTLSGEHDLLGAKVDWRMSRSYTSNETPLNHEAHFREDSAFDFSLGDVREGPHVIPGMALNRIDRAYFTKGEAEIGKQVQRDYVGSFDIEVPVTPGRMITGYVKFGGKHYNQHRYQDTHGARIRGPADATALARYDIENDHFFPWVFNSSGRVDMSTFMLPGSGNPYRILNGQYEMQYFPDVDMSNSIWHKLGHVERRYIPNHNYVFNDYNATERISSGYIMFELNIGPRLMILPGVRYEYEHSDYNAKKGAFHTSVDSFDQLDEDEREALIRDTTATRNMGMLFPMVQARYRVTDWFDIRVARTQTVTRAKFSDISPRSRINYNSGSVRRGHTQIRPMKSTNYDLFFTFNHNRIGLFTLGGFYKEVEDLIFTRNARIFNPEALGLPGPTLGFDITEPVNNENLTKVHGYEVEWQSNLTYLPAPFSGLVFNVNYTRLFSEAHYHTFIVQRGPTGFVGVDTFRVANMIHQANHIANLSVGYDLKGFSARVSMQFQGATLRSIGRREEEHQYTDDYLRFDASIKQRIFEFAYVFANLQNIMNREDRSSQFTYDRPRNIEYYGAAFDLGIEFRF